MRGKDVLWLPGTDHAAIATEALVERDLAEREGKSKREYTRDEFLDHVWTWTRMYGGRIQGQMRRLGDSVDWSRERFTMDEGLSAAVQTAFKRLYDDGLIYRAERIVNWCPGCGTAVSDIEVDHYDEAGELVSVRYGHGDESIVVATTRAETMLGDTAVAVHPEDERYQHLIGKDVALPLTNRRIPIVADDQVDPDVRHGCSEGHSGARPERLRDRAAARPTGAHHPGRARARHRARAVRGYGPVRGPYRCGSGVA